MSEQPRVLFCCFDVVPGPHAQSRRLTEYIKGLGDRFQVVVLSVKTADNSHIQRYHGARLLRVPVGSGELPDRVQAFDRAVRRQLESEEYLLVHFFDPFGGYALCEKRAELGYRVIYDASTFPSVEMPLAAPELESNRKFIARMRRQELFCLMNADSVVVSSEIGRSYVVELGVTANRVSILRAPVDLEPFAPDVMGRPDGVPMRLVHLGSQNPWAGLLTVVQALSQVPEALARLAVVGPKHPEEHAKLVDLVASLKLEKVVDFQEPVAHDDIHKVLAASDVGLVTLTDVERNRSPGGPLARLGEYLAAGRPVIAADLPLARELVPADAAVFYKPDDPSSLAEAITSLAGDPARRITLGAAARKAALTWDASSVRGALLDLYSTIAGPIAAPRREEDEEIKTPSAPEVGPIDDAVTQLGARPFSGEPDSGSGKVQEHSDPSTNKVKTDPAILGSDGLTDPQSGGGRPPVMGTPLQDDPPVIVGEMLPASSDARADSALAAVTDIEVQAQGQPVVMGQPVWLNEGPTTEVGDADAVPWVEAPSALPEFADTPPPSAPPPAPPSAGTSKPPLLYPFTPAGGVNAVAPQPVKVITIGRPPAADEPPQRDLVATPRAPMPAYQPADELGSGLEDTHPQSVIVDLALLHAAAEEILPEPPPVPTAPAPVPEGPPMLYPKGVPLGSSIASSPSGVQLARLAAASRPPLPPALPRAAVMTSPPRSSNSGLMAAPANMLAGIPLPPISAPPGRMFVSQATPPPLPIPPTPLRGYVAQATPPPLPPRKAPTPARDEIVEVHSDEVMEVGDEQHAPHDEVMEADRLGVDSAPESMVVLPPSALDPWLAQLVHGYCPPESQLFARHVPPTTMPGRD